MEDDKNTDLFVHLDTKLDKIETHLSSMDVTLSKQQVSLDEHIRRTNLIEEDLKPIKKHVSHVEGAVKLIGFISVLCSIVSVILKLFKVI